jgi:hypothetical protein
MTALTTLKQYPQWVCWKYITRNGKGTKAPIDAKNGQFASSTNPDTWSSYQAAYKAVNKYSGVGFVFSKDNDLAGMDLDDCLTDGQLADWAKIIVDQLNSYTEISPSGNGLKIFFRANLGEFTGGKRGSLELYAQDRYFTVTGNHWPGSPDAIEERTAPAQAIVAQFFTKPEPPPKPEIINGPELTLDDIDLINRAKKAANGRKFEQLWEGSTGGYKSRSEAHQALCNILAFWAGGDSCQMDRLFRQSGFYSDYAEKWDAKHFNDGDTYGERTIKKAIARQGGKFYTPTPALAKTAPPANNNGHDNGAAPLPAESQPPEEDEPGNSYYTAEDGQMVYVTWKTVGGDIIPVRKCVAPFVCRIEEKLTIYDEYEQNVNYIIKGKKFGIPFEAKISADDWADPKRLVGMILRYLPGKPPDTDPNLRRHWGPAISALTSEKNMKDTKAIPSTGWTPDGKGFVMPGGGVGEGYLCQLDVSVEAELGVFGITEHPRAENRQALAALLYLVKVYNPAVIYTLLAHAFLPPLLRWAGDEARYLYHIFADTGSLKTELSKLVMGLYGPTNTRAITYKWSGTPIGVEGRANALKDCLMLLDDLKPGTISENDKQRWVAFVQAAVDAIGRKRATMSGKAAISLPPRALILSTGEAIPEAGEASYTARMLLAELNKQPEGRNHLFDRLKETAPLLNGVMYEYIKWLLTGEGRQAKTTYKELQGSAIATKHQRMANNYASNRLGAVMLVNCLLDLGYIRQRTADIILKRHHAALLAISEFTDDKAHSERYSQRFVAALSDAIGTGWAKLSTGLEDRRVGWEDDDYIYLLGGAKEIVDQWLRQSGQTPINISKKDLRKQLHQDALTYSTTARIAAGMYDMQAFDPATKKYPMVTAIYKTNLAEAIHEIHETHDGNG